MGLRSPKNCFLGFFFHLFKWGKIYKTLHYSLLMCTCICASPWLEAGACDVSHVYTFVRVFVYVYTCVQRVHVCIQYVIKIRKIYRKITFFNGEKKNKQDELFSQLKKEVSEEMDEDKVHILCLNL